MLFTTIIGGFFFSCVSGGLDNRGTEGKSKVDDVDVVSYSVSIEVSNIW